MFEKLTYSVTFPATGRNFAGDIDFKTGFGTITGPNEAGKSLIIEIARWCLFGTAALRGKAEDYKTLKATLTFKVRGQQYVVERTHNTAKLTNSKVLATGTKPVNAHIVQLLGFGLEVFDVACAANQGDVERLASMKPTERKRMVDEVVGLNRLEDLAKWCGDEAKALERISIPPGEEPTPPSAPMGDLEAARAAYEEMHTLKGALSVVQAPPKAPACPGLQTAAELQPLAEAEREARAELNVLKARLASLPEPFGYTDDELDQLEEGLRQHELWQHQQRFERQHPRSTHTHAQLEAMAESWAVIGERDSLSRLVAELEEHGEVDCPDCQHHFFLENNRIEELRSKLQTMGDVEDPSLSPAQINAEMGKLDDWDLKTTQDEWVEVKDAVETHKPNVTQRDIDTWRRGSAAAVERKEIEDRIASIPPSTGVEDALQARQTYETNLARYNNDLENYEAWLKHHAIAQARAQELEPLAAQFPILGQLQIEWNRYRDRKELWDEAKAEFDRLTIEADGWRRAQTALNNLRTMVKGHLVPALSRVSSHLLAQMTGGQRNVVSVDQEFDVVVDGQPLSTLSGSGKAVANLALRLGLGQVLTNNVFSVFVGDEIDASMDDTRAGNLGECIRTLSTKISQIVLITHKSHGDADWCVNLGNGA